ncbi:MAG TPA: hypothetical protein VIE35_18510 [Dongiaceae bacterium]
MKPLGARPAPCSPRHADPVPPRRDEIVQLDGATKRALETGRARLLVGAALFALAFAAICGRLVDVTMLEDGIDPRTAEQPGPAPRSPSVPISSTATASFWPPASPPARSSPIRVRSRMSMRRPRSWPPRFPVSASPS